MNINRNNYENFFLLYIDNELSATERKAVDIFVAENPDLRAELLLLQESVIDPSDVVFENKDLLIKNEDFALLQEKLLLFADDELGVEECKLTAALLVDDADAAAEWKILQQTKLSNDKVVFRDKKLLYRHSGRVVPIKWWRVAAAAILLGFGLWTGVSIYTKTNKSTSGTSTVTAKNTTNKIIDNKTIENKTTATQPGETAKITDTKISTKETIGKETVTSPVLQQKSNEQPIAKNKIVDTKLSQAVKDQQNNITKTNTVDKKISNNLPKSYLENINNTKSNETISNNVPLKTDKPVNNSGVNNSLVQNNTKDKTTNPVIAESNNSSQDPTSIAAVPAVYKNENDRYVELEEGSTNRSKVGGFLRRVKRMVERNTNIKTGNSVKVAGFEIAIK